MSEVDLTARHAYLTAIRPEFVSWLEGTPNYYDAQVAGWWAWGIAQWIGAGWCQGGGPWVVDTGRLVRRGKEPDGINRQRPHLSSGGAGIHRKRPQLGSAGAGLHRKTMQGGEWQEYFRQIAIRLRNVRVCCGDFRRVLGPSPTTHVGLTGVFLDPPYDTGAGRYRNLYNEDKEDVSAAARAWALANGYNPKFRIALCGYEGEHDMPPDWSCVAWKAVGGYGLQGKGTPGRANRTRERIWFSPYCLEPTSLLRKEETV